VTTGLNFFANVGVAVPKIKESSQFPQYVGNETPRASNYSLQGGFDYNWPISERLAFFAASNVEYESKRYWYIDNADIQDPKTYLNGSLGLKSGALMATVWGKNLLDTKAYDTYDPNQATGLGHDVGLPNKPLSFGVELSFNY
jgi:iron complex outermembrane receptor protein